jgi:hypothetical protein
VDKIPAVDSNLYGESREKGAGTVASQGRTLLVADSIRVFGDIQSFLHLSEACHRTAD